MYKIVQIHENVFQVKGPGLEDCFVHDRHTANVIKWTADKISNHYGKLEDSRLEDWVNSTHRKSM